MASDHTKYLAGAIITENKIVTYRLLSRALKVHHNVAKRMLYDFHQKQNAKKSGSIHATYLVTGFQVLAPAPQPSKNTDGDVPMPSSPYMSSAVQEPETEAEPVRQKVITLVKEENLESAKAKYETVSSVHVYSLEPSTLQNLEILSSITQQIVADYISEDPLTYNKTYGVIQNPNVKRRTGARPPPAPLPIKQETKTAFAKTKDPKAATAETKTLSKPKEAAPGSGEQATKIGAPALLKRESSDLFKSFAKAKPPKAKPAKGGEDVPMKDVSSDEEEDSAAPIAIKTASDSHREARKAREAAGRKMLLDSDDEDDVSGTKVKTEPEPEIKMKEEHESASEFEMDADDADEDEEDETPSAPLDVKKQEEKEAEETEPQVEVSNGRRRGKRKVMKKKMTKDAEGYLVTKEEFVEESYSEDDTPMPTVRSKMGSSASSSVVAAGAAGAAKGKKATGKPGQGNIMSFFGKK